MKILFFIGLSQKRVRYYPSNLDSSKIWGSNTSFTCFGFGATSDKYTLPSLINKIIDVALFNQKLYIFYFHPRIDSIYAIHY